MATFPKESPNMSVLTLQDLQASSLVRATSGFASRGLVAGKVYRATLALVLDPARPENWGLVLSGTDGLPFASGRFEPAGLNGFETLAFVASEATSWGQREAELAARAVALIDGILKGLDSHEQ